ncbi:17-beta-hydroxysteroid dehydrogenase type 3-like [Hippocampus zosterae]|uniref:17-beta-hydroxysteroid dehydrogenase type 3-like n=1 Tax=Hippocampus zosterae TaxID=109293 RepID=UPI00223E8E19|nr:17-beta-hydroxysteroid dehydrogenase type 3-like [Hippocampus zosterae]
MRVLAWVGLFVLARKGLGWLKFLFGLVRPGLDLTARYGRGSWVLVTGSTDVGSNTESFYDNILNACEGLDVSVVVNNVGVDVLGKYCSLPVKDVQKIIDVNCYPVSMLCHKFIPRLLKRKHAGVVIVSSLAGEFPMAMHNIYSASKAFTDFLARTLAYEYPSLDVLSLRPSEVQTPMTFHKQDMFTITARQCAEGLCRVLGRTAYSEGHWNHQLQGALYNAVPEGLFNHVFMHHIAPEFISKRRLRYFLKTAFC